MMNHVVQGGFDGAVRALDADLKTGMPLSRWSESVLRYHFSRAITLADPDVEQLVECDRIDLVLAKASSRAFVEFKFYAKPVRADAYTGQKRGFKGGPSAKNLEEFRSCVNLLADRRSEPNLSKFIVLVYGDSKAESRSCLSYASHYTGYEHPRLDVLMKPLVSRPVETRDMTVWAAIYELEGREAR